MKTSTIAVVTFLLAPCVLVAAASPAGQLPAKSDLDLGNGVSLQLVLVPAGSFRMGSPIAEKERETDETPHQVTLTRAFYLGATHVTVDQFAAFVRDTGYATDGERAGQSTDFSISDGRFQFLRDRSGSWRETSYEQTGSHPVVHVSWNDAKAFCAWLSRKTKRTAFLPTEAQWEYAARAGQTTAYPWGDDPDEGKGWINGADGSLKARLLTDSRLADMQFFTWDDGFVFTSPAGSFRPNTFGVHDMTGNVWQWVEDFYGPHGEAPAADPAGAISGGRRVLRGGSWMFHARYSRLAGFRNNQPPDYRDGRTGFRIAVEVPVESSR